MRERIDPCRLAREGSVELVPVGQPVRFRHEQDGGGIPGEIQGYGRLRSMVSRASASLLGCHRLFQLPQPVKRKRPRARLTRLPAMHRQRRHRHPLRELRLGQAPSASARRAPVRQSREGTGFYPRCTPYAAACTFVGKCPRSRSNFKSRVTVTAFRPL